MADFFAHETAEVSLKAKVGKGTRIWNWAKIGNDAVIGENCVIAKGVAIDSGVSIGNNCKIQNNVSVYHGASMEDGVFVGPHACFTNDYYPRAVNPDGSQKKADDWSIGKTIIKKGASIGANSTIICGKKEARVVGEWAMVGAGSVVTRDVPPHGLAMGNPARLVGFVCKCGNKTKKEKASGDSVTLKCAKCGETFTVSRTQYDEVDSK